MKEFDEYKYCVNFLLKSTILENNGNRLYDCAYRAHRDVLTGRFYLSENCKAMKSEPNLVTWLVDYLATKKDESCNSKSIGSMELINRIIEEFPCVEFGAIQKLVNMTLKYVCLLDVLCQNSVQEYWIELYKCDCPLDSKILGKLEGTYKTWTKMKMPNYINA